MPDRTLRRGCVQAVSRRATPAQRAVSRSSRVAPLWPCSLAFRAPAPPSVTGVAARYRARSAVLRPQAAMNTAPWLPSGGFSLRSGRWLFTLVFVSVVQSGSVLACLHGAGPRPTVATQERPGAAGGVAQSVARRGRGLGALCRSAGCSSLCRLSVSGVFLAVVARRMYFRVAARHLSCHVGVGLISVSMPTGRQGEPCSLSLLWLLRGCLSRSTEAL